MFAVRAGSLGHIPWFGDLLIEDIIRYGVLAILIIFNTLSPRTADDRASPKDNRAEMPGQI